MTTLHPITQNPDPAVPGQQVEFCLDTSDVSLPVTLDGTWQPGGQTFSHMVTGEGDRCWKETVPGDAEGGSIVDDGGQVIDFGILVRP